jgi:hypothetical protein
MPTINLRSCRSAKVTDMLSTIARARRILGAGHTYHLARLTR